MYAWFHTRPDIAFALGKLSQHMQNQVNNTGLYLKGLMRYLRTTIDIKANYGPRERTKLFIYIPTQTGLPETDRKSTTGELQYSTEAADNW